jgi:hypothetical protein
MDVRQETEKMRAINLLGHCVEVEISTSNRLRGVAFYFNDKVLILKKDKEYMFININKYEDLHIHSTPPSKNH